MCLFCSLVGLTQDKPAIELTSKWSSGYAHINYFPEQRERTIDSIQAYSWHEASQQWVNKFIDQYIYDGSLNLIRWEREDWRDRGDWFNKFQVLYTYENNLKTDEIVQDWDIETDNWTNRTRYLFAYDEDHFEVSSMAGLSCVSPTKLQNKHIRKKVIFFI